MITAHHPFLDPNFYCEHLTNIELDKLELCWLRFDLIYAYKTLFAMIETDSSAFFRVNKKY